MWNTSGLGSALLILGLATLATAFVIVVIWQIAKTIRARSAVASDAVYKQYIQQTSEMLQSMSATLADIQPRLAAIEQMLRDVG